MLKAIHGTSREGFESGWSSRNNFGSGSHGLGWVVWVSRFCSDFFVQLPSFSPPFLQLPSKPGVCVCGSRQERPGAEEQGRSCNGGSFAG